MQSARILFRLLKKTYFPPRESMAPRGLRRLLVLSLFIPFFVLACGIHKIGFLLDELLFPRYRDVVIKEPIFVLGVPRSGTTLLQHVLAMDEINTSVFSGWEILFAPSITERRCWFFVGALDRRLGGYGMRLLRSFEARVFRSMRQVHRLSLFQPEEDDFLLFLVMGGTYLLVPFPFPKK